MTRQQLKRNAVIIAASAAIVLAGVLLMVINPWKGRRANDSDYMDYISYVIYDEHYYKVDSGHILESIPKDWTLVDKNDVEYVHFGDKNEPDEGDIYYDPSQAYPWDMYMRVSSEEWIGQNTDGNQSETFVHLDCFIYG